MNEPIGQNHATEIASIPPEAYLLIIGAMKCGTSSLFDALSQHPAVCPCVIKEPEFFTHHQSHGQDVSTYESLWPDFSSRQHRYALEASTGYTKYPTEAGVPRRMAEYGIAPRLIYVVRNPFERIVSHVSFVNMAKPNSAKPTDAHVLDASRYHSQISEYRSGLPESPLLVIDFADLATDMAAVARRIFEFADLDPLVPLALDQKNSLSDRSIVARRLSKSPVGGLIESMPSSWRQAGVRVLSSIEPKSRRRVVLTAQERALIHETLAADMSLLRDEHGMDVRNWGFDV